MSGSIADAKNERETLERMRLRIAQALDDPSTPARDLASLSRRLIEIVNRLNELAPAQSKEEQDIDSILNSSARGRGSR